MKQKLNVGFVTTYSGRWPKELPDSGIGNTVHGLRKHFLRSMW